MLFRKEVWSFPAASPTEILKTYTPQKTTMEHENAGVQNECLLPGGPFSSSMLLFWECASEGL